jgi:UDP-4-amino-4,6-dideoxy-N-acetyl-beta-L-altrosamine transaminase
MTGFIPYGKQHIDKDDIKAVTDALKSDFLTQGPRIQEFEKKICDYTDSRYCIAVTNGTAALHLTVAALQLESGYEGITSPNTFVASANCLAYNQLKPIFADIDPKTYCIDPLEIKKKITDKTKVIIPVDFAGQPADMEEIYDLAQKEKITVIEDAAHAIGSKYSDGSPVGSCKFSDMTIFSFHPVKTITTAEGGVITTNNKDLFEILSMLRTHGITKDRNKITQYPGPWYQEMQLLGFNYRLSEIHAALGISQLKKLNPFIEKRREIIDQYNQSFKDIPFLITPYEKPGLSSAFHLYVIKIDFEQIRKTRSEVMDQLRDNNIGTQVHYIPVHTQPYYQKNFNYKPGDYPVAENYYQSTLSLPLFPDMSKDDVQNVIKNIINLKN